MVKLKTVPTLRVDDTTKNILCVTLYLFHHPVSYQQSIEAMFAFIVLWGYSMCDMLLKTVMSNENVTDRICPLLQMYAKVPATQTVPTL